MSSEGQPLQFDLFSGELVDGRSDYQKRKDKNRNAPQQLQMFSTPEVVQVSANARPWLNEAPAPLLALEFQDTRTPEEVERDMMREAEKLTLSFLDDPALDDAAVTFQEESKTTTPLQPGVIFDVRIASRLIGLRTQLRARSIPVRPRRCPIR